MYKDITGIILAGGKSSRMGENKSLLDLGGKKVIERTADLMRSLFDKVILSTNTPNEFEFLKIQSFKDEFMSAGPLAGIHAGLKNSETENNFIISCDMPLMTEEMINYIIQFETDKPITVCRSEGFVQQLAGIYNKSVLPLIEKSLLESEEEIRNPNQKKRKCKVLSLIDETDASIIDAEKLEFYFEDLFFNMNKPEDYKKILNRFK